MKNVRVRIAPSPTGKLHIGTARTALFNFLFAQKNKGTFILRLEDTDQTRSTKESEEDILKGLSWLGLNWDEGPIPGSNEYKGDFGPYRQIERLEIYKEWTQKIIESGQTYYCYCTPEEVEAEKAEAAKRGEAPKYSGKCRECSKEQIEKYEKEGRRKVLRFKLNPEKIEFNDLIKGKIEFDMTLYGDPVIVKADGMPLYNFAVVVDDITMEISHIIRGEDHISNTPIQISLYRALKAETPDFAHIPLTLTPDKKKLSKRYGAVSVEEFRRIGYLKEALINFLALLGWSSGTEQEIYSLEDLVQDFSIDRMQKSNAIFDIQRLNWLNGVWVRSKSLAEITGLCVPYLKETGLINETYDREYVTKVISLVKERLKYLSETSELTAYFFKDLELQPEKLVFKKSTKEATEKGLSGVIRKLASIENWPKEVEGFNGLLLEVVKENNLTNGDVFWPTRYALSFSDASPSPAELLWALPREKSLERLNNALNALA